MSMPNLKSIYSNEFFAQWGKTNLDYVSSAEVITRQLHNTYRPMRIVDIGCGCGVYAHFFSQLGCEVVCIDGVISPACFGFEQDVHIQDLCVPFVNSWGSFDFVLCLDVAEHIPETYCDVFLDNICQFSNRLVLSCAPPGQKGNHHVNEQPKRYWVKRLSLHGFNYNRRATGVLCETFKRIRTAYMWMWEQISVYERS